MLRQTRKTLPIVCVSITVGFVLLLLTFHTRDNSSYRTRMGRTGLIMAAKNTSLSAFSPSVGDTSELSYHFIVFVIPTTPDQVDHRQLLRSTWMSMSAWPEEEFHGVDPKFLNFKIMFVVGQVEGKQYSPEFRAETSQHDDIFIVDYLFEELGVLKYKVLWGMLRSLLLFNFSYLVKVDMDTLVILPDLIKGLSERSADQMVYSGTCYGVLPDTDIFRPDADLTANYWNHRYCFGGGYFLSRDLIQHISELDSSLYVTLVDPEDWFVGWLVYHVRRKLGINTNEVQLEKNTDNYMKNERHSRYNFDGTWFLHFLRTPKKLTDAFNCRIKMVVEACPSKVYSHYDNGSCTCFKPPQN